MDENEYRAGEVSEREPIIQTQDELGAKRLKRVVVFQTIILMLLHLLMGMSLSIIGPTLHDLSTVNGFNYEELSRVASMWSLGNLFGIILGTFFSSHFLDHSHRVIMVILVIIAGSASSIPFARNLPLLGTLWFVQGVSFGNSDVLCVNMIVIMWGKRVPTAVGAYCAFCSFGSILGPFVAAPFLSVYPESPESLLALTSNVSSVLNLATSSAQVLQQSSVLELDVIFRLRGQFLGKVYVPYLIIGGISLLTVILQCCLNLATKITFGTTQKFSEASVPPSTEKHGGSSAGNPSTMISRLFYAFIIIFGFFIIGFTIARDNASLMFSAVITAESFGTSAQKSSLIMTIFNALRGLGRLTFTFLSSCVPLHILLTTAVALQPIIAILLCFFGLRSLVGFGVLLGTFSFLSSPSFPLLMAWISNQLSSDRRICGILLSGSGIGGLAGTWLSGWVFIHFGATGWFIMLFALSCSSFLLLTVLCVGVYGKSLMTRRAPTENGHLDENFSSTKCHSLGN